MPRNSTVKEKEEKAVTREPNVVVVVVVCPFVAENRNWIPISAVVVLLFPFPPTCARSTTSQFEYSTVASPPPIENKIRISSNGHLEIVWKKRPKMSQFFTIPELFLNLSACVSVNGKSSADRVAQNCSWAVVKGGALICFQCSNFHCCDGKEKAALILLPSAVDARAPLRGAGPPT